MDYGCSQVGFNGSLDRAAIPFDVIHEMRCGWPVIRKLRDRETERVFQRERSRRLPPEVQRRAHRKMLLLEAAERLCHLRVTRGTRLQRLPGDRARQ